LKKLKVLLSILKDGGVYHRKIPLNIAGKNYFEKTYTFKKDTLSIEVINLLPKVDFLQRKSKQLYDITDKLLDNLSNIHKNYIVIKRMRKKIVMFSKELEAVFRRMVENSNRLFYDSQTKLDNFEKQLNMQMKFYQDLEFMLIIALILAFIVIGYIVIKELLSLNKALSEKLYTDKLTKVYSREKLEEVKFGDNSVLILIDIDDFSSINELYGVEKGNKVLQVIANKLKHYNPYWDVFRVSSDVFGLYIHDISNMFINIDEKVEAIKKHIMFESIIFDDEVIDINITLGVAIGKNALHNALIALHMAKNNNVSYEIFTNDESFKKQIEFNKTWQKEIKYAIAESRIEPFFQAIVDKDKNVVKYECLMRLKKVENDHIKYIPPFFLDIATKTKQYLALSRLMIEKTFKAFADGGEFSINLNYMDIKSKTTRDLLEHLINFYDAKNRVTFEILESEGIDDYESISKFIEHFRKYGVKIAIDDFGSGYSNFKRIMAIQPDYIKFDGSLIKNIDNDRQSYILVRNLVNYAKELDIKTVAEFVHSKDVFDTCVYLGIDYFQGFWISEPTKDKQ